MFKKEAVIVNDEGLHAKSASEFVSRAGEYLASITLEKKGSGVIANAKSIVFVLSLEIQKGDDVVVSAEGNDEEEAVNKLIDFINKGFRD